jgi:hypothetical protein
MAPPVGLVVEPVVLNRLGIFQESATTVLADWQQRLEQLLDEQPVEGQPVGDQAASDQAAGEQWLSAAPSFALFCQEVLAWEPGDLRQPEELAAPVAVHLDDVDEVLRPDWIVPEPGQGEGPLKAQLLVQELPVGTPFDAQPKGADGRRCWEATPQQRLERLLKDSEHPIGLLWNGVALRLVVAPRGESSGHLTFPLEPMTTVDGRSMLAALQMLLGPDRLFEGDASNTRLRPLMEQSRKEQNELSTRLAEQVLEALRILLRGFDAAGLEVDDPSHIYGGLITVLLRLGFLLDAEDEELMPSAHHRYVINFGERSEEECRKKWPELMGIVQRKVKPERLAQNREIRARYWWRFGETCPALYEAIDKQEKALATPCINNTLAFSVLQTHFVFSHKLMIFPLHRCWALGLLQSRIHEFRARAFASSMKDDINDFSTDCVEAFPFPTALLDSAASDPAETSDGLLQL